MARDDREIKQGIRTEINDKTRIARVLGANPATVDADLDEIAAMYSQDELNRLVSEGVLAGDWKSAKKEAKAETDKKDK